MSLAACDRGTRAVLDWIYPLLSRPATPIRARARSECKLRAGRPADTSPDIENETAAFLVESQLRSPGWPGFPGHDTEDDSTQAQSGLVVARMLAVGQRDQSFGHE